MNARAGGFTLLEVLVALTIAGILLVALLRVFSGAIAITGQTDAYNEAAMIAESMLESLGTSEVLQVGATIDRNAGSFHIEATVHVYNSGITGNTAAARVIPYELAVTVSWQEQRHARSVMLRTLRLGMPQ